MSKCKYFNNLNVGWLDAKVQNFIENQNELYYKIIQHVLYYCICIQFLLCT